MPTHTDLAPTLTTERLILRGHVREDFGDCAAMWADPAVTRHIGGKTFTPEESWARVLRYIGHWSAMGFGYWAVRDRLTGRFVGDVGFADFKRELVPSLEGAPECGWVLAPWAQGRGLATEAVRAAQAWLDERRGRPRTACLIDVENTASFRVAAKAGFTEWVRTTYKGAPVVVLERSGQQRMA